MITIAVTGGVACGKSTAVDRFVSQCRNQRIGRIDCDQCVAGLLERPELIEAIDQLAPDEKLVDNRKLNRVKLRELTFANSMFRGKLEALLHPQVLEAVESSIRNSRSDNRIFLVEVPLLYEVEFPMRRDIDLVVAASKKIQVSRMVTGRGLSPQIAEQIIGSQLPIENKVARGDVVLWNDGEASTLHRQIDHLAARCRSFLEN